ncbi:MAG: DUF4783 domain-containing protein [Flavobacteriales bacterium]|nr:DUF4783 domain-containing protein [Flavobacteriales bacterium]
MWKIWTLVVSLSMHLVGFGQDNVKDKVVLALKTGNAKELSSHFIPNIDLTVGKNSDVYSKAQAEQILDRFFEELDPRSFEVEHEGVSKMGDSYYIGNLTGAERTMRVTFFLKRTGSDLQVKQLRIEPSSGSR